MSFLHLPFDLGPRTRLQPCLIHWCIILISWKLNSFCTKTLTNFQCCKQIQHKLEKHRHTTVKHSGICMLQNCYVFATACTSGVNYLSIKWCVFWQWLLYGMFPMSWTDSISQSKLDANFCGCSQITGMPTCCLHECEVSHNYCAELSESIGHIKCLSGIFCLVCV